MQDPAVESLRRLCDEHGRVAVADEIGANEQTLYQIIRGIPLASGKPRTVGRNLREKLDRHYPGWLDLAMVVREALPADGWTQSRNLRHPPGTFDAPLVGLTSIMDGTTPGTFFRTLIDDDACAPELPRGVEILWHTTREARPGRFVLVLDRHGQAHVRQYRQGREPGRWTAAALNPAYTSLDSLDDELRVLAVKKAVLDPDD